MTTCEHHIVKQIVHYYRTIFVYIFMSLSVYSEMGNFTENLSNSGNDPFHCVPDAT